MEKAGQGWVLECSFDSGLENTHLSANLCRELGVWTHQLSQMFLGVGVAWWVQIQQAFKAQDASFTITVSGVERSSMQPVFSERLYAVADGDVLWDRQFEDQIHTDQYGRSVFYSNRLSRLKPLEAAGDVNTQDEASNNNHRKKPKVQWSKHKWPKSEAHLLVFETRFP